MNKIKHKNDYKIPIEWHNLFRLFYIKILGFLYLFSNLIFALIKDSLMLGSLAYYKKLQNLHK